MLVEPGFVLYYWAMVRVIKFVFHLVIVFIKGSCIA